MKRRRGRGGERKRQTILFDDLKRGKNGV